MHNDPQRTNTRNREQLRTRGRQTHRPNHLQRTHSTQNTTPKTHPPLNNPQQPTHHQNNTNAYNTTGQTHNIHAVTLEQGCRGSRLASRPSGAPGLEAALRRVQPRGQLVGESLQLLVALDQLVVVPALELADVAVVELPGAGLAAIGASHQPRLGGSLHRWNHHRLSPIAALAITPARPRSYTRLAGR